MNLHEKGLSHKAATSFFALQRVQDPILKIKKLPVAAVGILASQCVLTAQGDDSIIKILSYKV